MWLFALFIMGTLTVGFIVTLCTAAGKQAPSIPVYNAPEESCPHCGSVPVAVRRVNPMRPEALAAARRIGA